MKRAWLVLALLLSLTSVDDAGTVHIFYGKEIYSRLLASIDLHCRRRLVSYRRSFPWAVQLYCYEYMDLAGSGGSGSGTVSGQTSGYVRWRQALQLLRVRPT